MNLMRSTTVLAVCLAAACSRTPAADPPAGDPYARGVIGSIAHHATGSGYQVRPLAGTRDECGISATADARTRFFARTGGTVRAAERGELQVGDTVEVYVQGAVALSCPPQGYASAIVLVGEGK